MHRFTLVTDAWYPQTNGVVTTWNSVLAELQQLGIEVQVIHPGDFKTLPVPTYAEVRVAVNPWRLKPMLWDYQPDYIHIATEGPLGLYARHLLVQHGLPFTTSLHTKFPEYVHERVRLPLSIGYRFMRWFHRPARSTLVTTWSHQQELAQWGLTDLIVWGRGVDVSKFKPQPLQSRQRPRLLYVGRVAVEKNIEAFLQLSIDADKVIVGDGPQRAELQANYPDVQWLGYLHGQDLTDAYAQADVFVFPSRTDTFGLVMLEANACGTPVAAYPVTGPIDVVADGHNGALDEALGAAVQRALAVPRDSCRAHALAQTWSAVANRLEKQLVPITRPLPRQD